jgi:hypothetical protein
MKTRFLYFIIIAAAIFASCQKEYSTEEGNNAGAGTIIGTDCRINKIGYSDSAGIVGIGSIGATINGTDAVTDVTKFDSLTLTLDFFSSLQYFSDTVYIDPDQYFIVDNANKKRITLFHGLIDPTVPGSPEIDVDYIYNASGQLIEKDYYFSLFPVVTYQTVFYTYAGGNLTGMVTFDDFTGDVITDADLTYYTTISPKNYMYLFPDENTYAEFNQFFNFGNKSTNAVKSLKVRYYDPGNVVIDSAVSNFQTYIMSRDNYVLNVNMNGDDQSSIPAAAGKLNFTYKCK